MFYTDPQTKELQEHPIFKKIMYQDEFSSINTSTVGEAIVSTYNVLSKKTHINASTVTKVDGLINRKVIIKKLRNIHEKYSWFGTQLITEGLTGEKEIYNFIPNPYVDSQLTQRYHSVHIESLLHNNVAEKEEEAFLVSFETPLFNTMLTYDLYRLNNMDYERSEYNLSPILEILNNNYSSIYVNKVQRRKSGSYMLYIYDCMVDKYSCKSAQIIMYYHKDSLYPLHNFSDHYSYIYPEGSTRSTTHNNLIFYGPEVEI